MKAQSFRCTYTVRTDAPNEAHGGTAYFVVGAQDVTSIDVQPGLVTVETKAKTFLLTPFGAAVAEREIPKPVAQAPAQKGRAK